MLNILIDTTKTLLNNPSAALHEEKVPAALQAKPIALSLADRLPVFVDTGGAEPDSSPLPWFLRK